MPTESQELPFQTYRATSRAVWLRAPLDDGVPDASHFEVRETAIVVDAEHPLEDGAVLLRVHAMSADPYLRGHIKSTNLKTTEPSPMKGFVAGKVLASKNEKWQAGDVLCASLPFASVQIVTAEALNSTISWNLTEHIKDDSEITLGVGALGMPGATAYGGLIDVLRPEDGQTLFVSSASGAVGSLVGQIAKNVYNCRVIGSCGGPDKVERVTSVYGFDAGIDYKDIQGDDDKAKCSDLVAKLRQATDGDGIDMYFENVGGVHFDAAMQTLRPHGRIAVCGCISGYNDANPARNSIYIGQMIYTFQRIEGFVCMPWLSGKRGNFLRDMAQWIAEGKVEPDETFFDGVAEWPTAFNSLFTATDRKRGKVVVRIGEEDCDEEVSY